MLIFTTSVRAFHSLSLEQLGAIYCFPATYTFSLTIDHRFTIGLKSLEQGSNVLSASSIIDSTFHQLTFRV